MTTRLVIMMLMLMPVLAAGCARVKSQTLDYKCGETTCEGYLAWDSLAQGKRPGVLVVHAWKGIGEFEKGQADELARMGYVALCADIYGKGVRAETTEQARALATKFRNDRRLMRDRALAGLQALKAQPQVDASRIGAIGYCFGGGVVLELARDGADFQAAVSFHGNLDTPHPEQTRDIKPKVLVLHGAADPVVPMSQVAAFIDEMEKTDADYQVVIFAHAPHAFTEPGTDSYRPEAARRSWEYMRMLFDEVFEK